MSEWWYAKVLSADVIDAIDRTCRELVELGARQELTKVQVSCFESDVRKSYEELGQSVPAPLLGIIDRLYSLAGGIKVVVKEVPA